MSAPRQTGKPGVFADAAHMLGLNPLDLPADQYPCFKCGTLRHFTKLIITWEPARRGFLCVDCAWCEQTGETMDELGALHFDMAQDK